VALLHGNLDGARNSIKRLAGDPNGLAKNDRKKFQKTFKNFANVKDEQRGPDIAELTKPVKKSKTADEELSECLRRLYTTLHQFCRSAATTDGGDYQANVGLNLLSQSRGEDGLTAHLYLLHKHKLKQSVSSMMEWKEAHIRVYLERYVPTTRHANE
jgi:hypothetical protein